MALHTKQSIASRAESGQTKYMHGTHANQECQNKTPAKRRLPTLDLLKGFDAAARHLSFTRAGEELFLTQSALSRQMQILEEQLGAPLFERRHRALRLTEAGQVLQLAAKTMLDELTRAVAKIRREQSAAPLTISTAIPLPPCGCCRGCRGFANGIRTSTYSSPPTTGYSISIASVSTSPFAIARSRWRRAMHSACSVSACSRFAARRLATDPARPLKQPEDLARHVLLNLDDDRGRYPWLNWAQWFAAIGVREPRPAGIAPL